MEAIASALCVHGFWEGATVGETRRGRGMTHCPWDQAEQNVGIKEQFLASVKSAQIAGEQINNEGATVHLYGNRVPAPQAGCIGQRH